MTNIEQWLNTFVNAPEFSAALTAELAMLDKPLDRIKLRMELLSYVVPKVKGVEPNEAPLDSTFILNYETSNAAYGKPASVPASGTDK